MRSEFILDGLHCANCAAKIEGDLREKNFISDLNMNFVTKKLTIEHSDDLETEIYGIVKEVVNNREKSVVVLRGNDTKEKTINYTKHIPIIIGLAMFLLNIFIKTPYYVYINYIAYFLIASNVIKNMVGNIKKGDFLDEYFLMFVATLGAMYLGEYVEGVAVLILYELGEYLQDRAVDNSRKEIKKILDVRSDIAYFRKGFDRIKVNVEDVKVGDEIEVIAGESIPLDGVVVRGNSFVNTALITGENVPRGVEKGSDVLSGFINNDSPITIEVTKLYKESTLSKILRLVEDSTSTKTKSEKLISKIAKIYTPIVVVLALMLFLIPTFVFSQPYEEWLHRSLVFLVISCPCALVISIPLSFFSGIGLSSKSGILLKGSNYLESLNNIDTVVFDKTGTLTKGVFNIVKVEGNVLYFAKSLEMFSNHPIAKAIASADSDYSQDVTDIKEISGYGLEGVVDNKRVLIGSEKLMEREGVDFEKVPKAIHVLVDGNYEGYLVVDDEVREGANNVVDKLSSMGKDLYMLTGDNEVNANLVANGLGIKNVRHSLLPADKLNIVQSLEKTKNVLFVGDGMNDAPVIAASTVGSSMGGIGSDAAIEASDMVIMNDKLDSIIKAFTIAKLTRDKVIQNVAFVLLVKIIVLTLGAFGIANMWIAIFADVGVSIIATINAVTILRKDIS